jgi:hypothetical protein
VKAAVTTVLAVKLLMLHTSPDTLSQPDQATDVALPVGVAVNVIAVPLAKFALHVDRQLLIPPGLLLTLPVPETLTVRRGPAVPVKQTTFAVMLPVTMAPDDDRPPALLFVFTVAEMSVFPQARPVAVISPVEFTVTICGVFEDQITWFVMSLSTGGWI